MRKLLVIVLMLALVPFTTGCRIDGLWGFNDDEGTAVAPVTTTLPLKVTLPATIGTAAIRALVAADMDFYVVYADNTTDAFTKATDATTGKVTLTLNAKTNFTSDGTNYSVKIRIKDTKNNKNYDFVVKVSVKAIGATDTTVEITGLVLNADGTITVTYKVSFTLNGTATVTETLTSTGSTTDATTGTAVTSLLVPGKVVYVNGTTETEMSTAATTTGIDINTPKFKIYFNQEVAATPDSFKFSVTPVDSTAKTVVEFTAAAGQLAIAQNTDKKGYTITITGQSATKNASLNPGTTYKVAVTGVVKSADGKATYTVTTAETYTIKTAAVKVASWKTLDAAGAALTGYDSTTSKVKASTAKGVSVTFDYAMTLPTTTELSTAKFSMSVAGATATAQLYTTYFNTPTLSADKKTVTMMFKNSPIMKTGAHVITWDSSFTAKDLYGKALDTTTSISFTAE